MASPKTDSAKTVLSEREMEILSKAWKCMKVQPEIDYTKLAGECGMTNVRSASNAWGAIKKKLFADMATQSPGSAKKRKTPTAASKATAGGKKGDADASDDDDQVDETPTKKRTRTKAKPKTKKEADVKKEDVKVKKEEESDDDNAKAKEHEVVNVEGSEGSAGVEAGVSDAAKHD